MRPEEFTTYQAGVLQARAYRALRNFMNEHLSGHGLTVMEWNVLGLVFDFTDKGGAKVGQLADLLNVEISLITSTLNKLEPAGHIQRMEDEKDSRAKRVITTRSGEKKVKKIEKQLKKEMEEWLSDIRSPQLAQYIRTLQNFARKEKTGQS